MPKSMMEYALHYRKRGFSVIPCKKDKKPYLKSWQSYQLQKPTEDEIRLWWNEHPEANIAIVCGPVSGVDVLDVDTEEAYQNLTEFFIPESLQTPIAKTPKGRHLYFKHRGGLSNAVRVIAGTDLRTMGGYVIAPPSQNGNGTPYHWLEGLTPKDCEFAEWPDDLFATLQQGGINLASVKRNKDINSSFTTTSNSNDHANKLLLVTERNIRNISFDEGSRDDSLFHLLWHLKKSGMPKQEIEIYAHFVGSHCNPPLPENEINAKIQSAYDRKKRAEHGLTDAIKDFLSVTKGNFSVTDVMQVVTNVTNGADRASVRAILHRLSRPGGLLKRDSSRDGVFRKIETDCEVIDFKNCETRALSIDLPLGLTELVEIMPGNVIIIAGVSNMGKTAFLLDVIFRNMKKFDVWYFNSEMDGKELNKRLRDFKAVGSINDWKFNSRGIVDNMEDIIAAGEGKINIIDYLEVDEKFYLIPGMIKAIHANLKGAIAVIALQKKPGAIVGIGGYGTVNKARLALNIEKGECHIMKAKNWASRRNPNGLKIKFDIKDGWDITGRGGWYQDVQT